MNDKIIFEVNVNNGMYTYRFYESRLSEVLLYGEVWRYTSGDGLILTMARRIAELEAERNKLQRDRDWVSDALGVPKHEGIACLCRVASEHREKHEKYREEREALAAHVERLETLAARYLESSQETVELLRASGGAPNIEALASELDSIADGIGSLDAPQTSLAQRDARMKAEALEEEGNNLPEHYAKRLWRKAEEYRQQADTAGPMYTPDMAGSGQFGICAKCGLGPTPEGHDGCLGTLPEETVMNACCGHGREGQAYVQRWGGECVRGREALVEIEGLKAKQAEGNSNE